MEGIQVYSEKHAIKAWVKNNTKQKKKVVAVCTKNIAFHFNWSKCIWDAAFDLNSVKELGKKIKYIEINAKCAL